MRLVSASVALLLAACATHSNGPAWPASAGTVVEDDWKDDGGESLEPRSGLASGLVEGKSSDDEKKSDDLSVVAETAKETPAKATEPVDDNVQVDDGDIKIEPVDGGELVIEITSD